MSVSDETRIKWVQRIADILSGAISKWPERPGDANERYYEVRDDMKADAELWALLPAFIRETTQIEGVVELISNPGMNAIQRVAYVQAALDHTIRQILNLSLVKAGETVDAFSVQKMDPELPGAFGLQIADGEQTQDATTVGLAVDSMYSESRMGSPLITSPSQSLQQTVSSSSWTGRRTATEQAVYVRGLVPDAVAAIDSLIAEQAAMRRHNHPPETLEDEQLAALRALRDALTDLLDAVEHGRPIEGALGHLRVCIGATFGFAKDTGRLILANAPAVGAASVFGWATYAIATMVAGIEPGAAATMAAGKMAVSALKSSARARS